MSRLIGAFALVALVALVGVAAFNFGQFSPLHNGYVPFSDIEFWLAKEQFFALTALLASFTSGMLALLATWRRHPAWITPLVVTLLFDAYGVVVFDLLGHLPITGAPGDPVDYLIQVGAPALPAALALAYAVRYRAEGPGAPSMSLITPRPTGLVDGPEDDAIELRYSPLGEGDRASED